MNEESKEMPQNTEVIAEQISPEVTQAPEVKAEVAPTPDKSITETKRSFWDKILGRKDKAAAVTVATETAVAAGMAMAPNASAETQEKPTTSISQITEAQSENNDAPKITEEDGHVVGVETEDIAITKVDNSTINIVAEDIDKDQNKSLETLQKEGMDIKDVTYAEENRLEVDVDDADKLDRIKDAPIANDPGVGMEDGHVVKAHKDGVDIAKVDNGTINVVADKPLYDGYNSEHRKNHDKAIESLGKDMIIKEDSAVGDKTLEIEVDDANKLDNLEVENK